MKAGSKKLAKDEILFREGDPSDAAFVIKSGKISITKAKGNSEIILAEIGPGSMLGEMAFFDNKPRSAGAKASTDTEVITLPFAALHAQFKTFPEWLKVMVKTINGHVRDANKRIKNLEHAQKDDTQFFDPHSITRVMAILTLVGEKFGEKEDGGINIPTGTLRKYTIQIFQQPTNKMLRMTETLNALGYVTLEDMGEGRQRLIIKNLKLLSEFVDYYNEYLFTEEAKRVSIREEDIPTLKALSFYAKKALEAGETKAEDGTIKISLTNMQNESMKDLGELIKLEMVDCLVEKSLCSEKMMNDNQVYSTVDLEKIEPLIDYWTIIYALEKVKN